MKSFLLDCKKVANNETYLTKNHNERTFNINAKTAKSGAYVAIYEELENVYNKAVKYTIFGTQKDMNRVDNAVKALVEAIKKHEDIDANKLTVATVKNIVLRTMAITTANKADLKAKIDVKCTAFTTWIKTVVRLLYKASVGETIEFKETRTMEKIQAKIDKREIKELKAKTETKAKKDTKKTKVVA